MSRYLAYRLRNHYAGTDEGGMDPHIKLRTEKSGNISSPGCRNDPQSCILSREMLGHTDMRGMRAKLCSSLAALRTVGDGAKGRVIINIKQIVVGNELQA